MAIQDKFNKANVIYKITKDIDLDGGTLTIPEGCTLDFQGGSFSNGKLVFNKTKIINAKILACGLSGSVENNYFNIVDFGAVSNDSSIDNSSVINDIIKLKFNSYSGPKTIYIPTGRFYIKESILLYDYFFSSINLIGEGDRSIISQLTDNIPIIKHYETNRVSNIRLEYQNRQPVENTQAIAVAAQRMIYSLYENVTIRMANTGFGFLTPLQVSEDGIMSSDIPPCHVNASLRNIKIYAFSNCALDFKKKLSNGDSGSVYSNIYISSDDWDGVTGIYTAVSALRMQNTSACFDQLNIEGTNYSSNLIDMISIDSILQIASLHVEGMPIKHLIYVYSDCFVDIGNINITRCDFSYDYYPLIYALEGSALNIESIRCTNCTSTNKWSLVGGSSTKSYNIGSFKINTEALPLLINGSPDTLNVNYGRKPIKYSVNYQTIQSMGQPYDWLMDASSDSSRYYHNKVFYKDKDNNLRHPDGNLAYYNNSIIRKVGNNDKIPDLSSPGNNINVGMCYFNTTLNKPIWWTGSKWVDATGADV